MRFHEFEKAEGSTLAVRQINRYADEVGKQSMDYEVLKTAAEMLDKQMLKSLAQLLDDSDTAPREYIMKKIADHDPDTFKKMYGDQEGYLSVMKPMKNLTDAEDNTDRGMNKYGLAARHKDGKFHSFRHGKHTGSFDSAEELAKHQQELIQNESQPDGSAERAEAAKGMWASSKEIQSRFKTWQDFMNSEDFDEWLDDKFRDKLGEDAPFGSGMELLRMAIMRKFITVQEWDLLKHKWKEAAAEVEEKYSDWPDGEGFGSSDHNFAIRDLMTAVGYEFDDQDTSGSFVVTKQPEEIEKAGIKNARMKDAVATEDSVKEGASMIPYFKSEKEFDGEKSTVYEFPMAWAKDKELDTPYLSNASMRQFLTLLGYPADFEEMSAVPIDEFIGVSTQWLKKNIGKPSQEIPTTVDRSGGGATMIGGGKPEGWDNRQVKHHNELARKILAKYPEVTHFGFN